MCVMHYTPSDLCNEVCNANTTKTEFLALSQIQAARLHLVKFKPPVAPGGARSSQIGPRPWPASALLGTPQPASACFRPPRPASARLDPPRPPDPARLSDVPPVRRACLSEVARLSYVARLS